jgi:amidase
MSADLMFRPANELAAMIRSGALRARELVEISLERIETLNPRLNAFVDVFADEALAAADAVRPDDTRPFAGVPIAIKNNRAIAGKRLTCGAGMMAQYTPSYDHNVVRRLLGAGFVVVGTTTMPEWGILPVSEARLLGPTRNPWDLQRTPGGSSGGSAAAVAAGMVPIAHGNDGGGSIRIPAACCGLVGLKPQRGRVSLAPEAGHGLLVQDGVLTRTVAETAQLLDLLAGYEVGDIAWAPPPAQPFADAAAAPTGPMRIAVATAPPFPDAVVDPVCARAAADAAALLASLGHDPVEVDDPPWGERDDLELFSRSFGPAVCLTVAFAATLAGREPTPDDMEPLSWELWRRSRSMDSVVALGSEMQLHGVARRVVTWLDGFDALLTPALAEAPVTLGTIDSRAQDAWGSFRRSAQFTPYTALFNITGSPAITVPLYQRDDGLPLAVQLVGQPAQEGRLLALAAQLEQAQPWAARRPPLA